jgi:hypothetical protein
MELKYDAIALANLEDELGISLLKLFADKDKSVDSAMSMSFLLSLVGAGLGGDKEKANEYIMEKLAEGKNQIEVFTEVFEIIKNLVFSQGEETPEKEPSDKSGKETK